MRLDINSYILSDLLTGAKHINLLVFITHTFCQSNNRILEETFKFKFTLQKENLSLWFPNFVQHIFLQEKNKQIQLKRRYPD